MKFQMTKGHTIGLRRNLPVSMQSVLIKNQSSETLRTLFQGLLKIFFKKEKNNSINNEKSFSNDILIVKENETQSLQQLEDCANAARKTEGYGQYE